jgi:hypothetical protein
MSHFVQEVLSTVGYMFMLLLQSQDCLPAIVSAHGSVRNPAVKDPQSGLSISIPARILHNFMVAGCHKMMHAYIHAHRLVYW